MSETRDTEARWFVWIVMVAVTGLLLFVTLALSSRIHALDSRLKAVEQRGTP